MSPSDYICPQCGPAPEGPDEHAERFHTAAGLGLGARSPANAQSAVHAAGLSDAPVGDLGFDDWVAERLGWAA